MGGGVISSNRAGDISSKPFYIQVDGKYIIRYGGD